MGRTVLISLFFLAIAVAANACGDTTLHCTIEKTIPGDYVNFYTDNFGDVFLVSKTNQLKKLTENLDSVAVFNDVRRYGNIYSLDVSNPLKILVYYRDYTTILVLDRFLNIRNTIDLRRYDILQAEAVAQSYDNNYWIFDELDNTIKKIDDNGNVLLRSSDFRVLFEAQYAPSYIVDSNGLLYLYDEKKGWLVFDYYGTFRRHIDIAGLKDAAIAGNQLVAHDSACIYDYDLKTFSLAKVYVTGIDLASALKIQREAGKIFVLQKGSFSVYSIDK